MNQTGDAPGLKARKRVSGPVYYWVAAAIVRDTKGFEPRTVRLHHDTEEARAERCRALTLELREWLDDPHGTGRQAAFTGTLSSLIACYQTEEESPYRGVKANTRAHYDECLAILSAKYGERRIDALTGRDFMRWYRTLREPAETGGPERMRRAHNCIKVLRIVTNYGAACGYTGCAGAAMMLSKLRFEVPAPRKVAMTFEQAKAIVEAAIAQGRRSIALAQALQFELGLRQKDVIGEWIRDDGVGGITGLSGRRWTGGATWSDIDAQLVLRKATTKTGTVGEWNLRLYPLVMLALASYEPLAGRTGPLVIDEGAGRPYTYRNFFTHWREASAAAGVPRDVWNMDSRAGSITEGADAGADVEDLRKHATHTDAKMTGRYIRRTQASTEKVANLRTARRTTGGTP